MSGSQPHGPSLSVSISVLGCTNGVLPWADQPCLGWAGFSQGRVSPERTSKVLKFIYFRIMKEVNMDSTHTQQWIPSWNKHKNTNQSHSSHTPPYTIIITTSVSLKTCQPYPLHHQKAFVYYPCRILLFDLRWYHCNWMQLMVSPPILAHTSRSHRDFPDHRCWVNHPTMGRQLFHGFPAIPGQT